MPIYTYILLIMKALLKQCYTNINNEFKTVVMKDTMELVTTVKRNVNSMISSNNMFKSKSVNDNPINTSVSDTQINSSNISDNSLTKFNSNSVVEKNFNNNSVDSTSTDVNTITSSDNFLSRQLENAMANESSVSSNISNNYSVEQLNNVVKIMKDTTDKMSASLAENFVNTTIDIANNNIRAVSIGLNTVSEALSFTGAKTLELTNHYLYEPLWQGILYYIPNPTDYKFFIHKSELENYSANAGSINNTSKDITVDNNTASTINKKTNNLNVENSNSNVNLSENSLDTNLSNSVSELNQSMFDNLNDSIPSIEPLIQTGSKFFGTLLGLFFGVLSLASTIILFFTHLIPFVLKMAKLGAKVAVKGVKVGAKVAVTGAKVSAKVAGFGFKLIKFVYFIISNVLLLIYNLIPKYKPIKKENDNQQLLVPSLKKEELPKKEKVPVKEKVPKKEKSTLKREIDRR